LYFCLLMSLQLIKKLVNSN